MPSRAWFAAIAFGLAFSFQALAQQHLPEQPVEPSETEQQTAEQPAIEAGPVAPEIAPTVPASREHDESATKDSAKDAGQHTYLIFGDGWAQWVMAATGFAAFVLSAWAVWLLKETLKATRGAVKAADDAVEVTREIGEAQTRAYLHCVSANYKLAKDSVAAILSIENIGNSPASKVEIIGDVTMHDVSGRASHTRVTRWVTAKDGNFPCQPIVTKGKTSESIAFSWDMDFFPNLEDDDDVSFKRDAFDTANEIWFDLTIQYSDVFGKKNFVPLSLEAIIDAHPHSPNKKRSRNGKLDIRIEDGRIHTASAYQPVRG